MTRALERGLRGTVAVMLLAIIGAVLFPQSEGERFGTCAYLAAIFAAVLLAAWHCMPKSERLRSTQHVSSAPAIVAFWVVVGVALGASAAEAANLQAELLVAVACAIPIVVAALFPSGLFTPLHRYLAKDRGTMTVTRYTVVLGIAAWSIAAMVPSLRQTAAIFGFAMLVVACALIVTLLRPMRHIMAGSVIAMAAAFATAACVPAIAQGAAQLGYAASVFVMGVLVLRARYA